LKVLAAERAGADAFLLPPRNVAEARSVAERIEVVPVATLGDAVEYLESS
jgi:PDZ domain-containing secreted protein